MVFHPEAPVLKYYKKLSNSCCLSSLASEFHSISKERDAAALENGTGESLTSQTYIFSNRIDFSNDI